MRILIVDNGTKSLQNLFLALQGHQVTARRFEDYDVDSPPNTQTTDLVILSGGSQYPIVHNEVRFARETELIRESPIPILGICFGAELIAYAFGSELKETGSRVHGPVTLTRLLPEDPLFASNPPLQVFESHTWSITTMGPELVGLARSEFGYEIFRHRTLPRYGFQFHPEARFHTNGGTELLENALRVLKQK